MTIRTARFFGFVLCATLPTLVVQDARAQAPAPAPAPAAAPAQPPKPIKNGEVLSGELRVMRSRAKGKRINTYQVLSEARRIPGPDGLCNLETGPETFQIVTQDDADVKRLKPFIGKTITLKANEMSCATAAGQVSDALVLKWSIVQ